MDRSSTGAPRRGRTGSLITLFALVLAVATNVTSVPAASSHVCVGCHGAGGTRPLTASSAELQPEAFVEPTSPLEVATPTNDSVSYTLSATTVRFKAGTYRFFRFNADTGLLINKRDVRFSTAVKFRAAHKLSSFSGQAYVRLTSGTWSGWYATANDATPSTLTAFTEAHQVRLTKGTHTGVRFYDNTRVRMRRSATLAAANFYDVSQRATFNDKTWFRLANGPLADRWVAKSSSVTLVSTTSDSSDSTTTATAPATWKAIVLIYRDTDVTFTRSDGSTYRLRARMSDKMYNLSRDVINRFVNAATSWSDGYTGLDLTVVDVPRTIDHISALPNGKYWVAPKSVKADMDKYAPTGTYDSVFVLWEAKDSSGVRVPTAGWGLTVAPGSWANGAGFSSIHTPAEYWWWDVTYPQEVFVHEWMHQVLFFHENGGRLKLDLHAASQYGYTKVDGTYRLWLSDVMRGLVKDGTNLLGLSYPIWRAASPTKPQGWTN